MESLTKVTLRSAFLNKGKYVGQKALLWPNEIYSLMCSLLAMACPPPSDPLGPIWGVEAGTCQRSEEQEFR